MFKQSQTFQNIEIFEKQKHKQILCLTKNMKTFKNLKIFKYAKLSKKCYSSYISNFEKYQ